MNLSKLFVGAALAISMVGLTSTLGKSVGAEQDKKICAVESFKPQGYGPLADPDKKFTKKDGKVYIGVKVWGEDCTRNVTLAGWLAQSLSGKPYNQQELYAHKTRHLTPGEYVMGIDLPSDPNCFYQIDLVRGTDPYGKNGGGAYEDGRMIHSLHGGKKDCYSKPPVTPETPKKIKVCELATRRVIIIDEKQFDATKHTLDFSKCQPSAPGEIKVCELATKTEIIIKETEFDSAKHSHDLSRCKVEETPEAIASTGPAAVISAVSGVAALAGSAQYYWQSRRR